MTARRATTTAERPIQAGQRRAIHAIRRDVGLDDASYRGLLAGVGVASSSDLTEPQADAVIARLRALQKPRKDRADGPFAKKLWALWISGWNLGVIRNKSDAALHAFIEDRFGVSHSRFLIDQHQAQAVIEGVKAWLERSAGVDWPTGRMASGPAATQAVLVAQWRRAVALDAVAEFPPGDDGLREYAGQVVHGDRSRFRSVSDPALTHALYRVSNDLGVLIRAAQAAGGDDE
ncbi:regulatory protein GemA [Methylobacterium aquaticum]|uniref:regulatory protein GemA n=1 Tax=Methylobacterium aquaticum TaxID=270351 RepID=UPI0019341109|nr:regulatory protein GemA [Methylobacterium aquaticum]QRE74405.1 regulatory protein GemA [Methylobacterium aquaticum]